MLQDLRYGLRALTKSPGFAAVAAVVLALGIGVNTALFSLVYAVFFRPLPVHEPDRLVYLYWIEELVGRPTVMGIQDLEFFRDHTEAFDGMTAHWGFSTRFTTGGETDAVRGESVLANYFDVLGVKPVLGRAFTPDDDSFASTEFPIVISHSLWTRRFEKDPGVIGRQVRLQHWRTERHFTVVGVMGPEFKGVSDPWTPSEFWVTFAHARGEEFRRTAVATIARLKPGVTLDQARSIVTTQGEQLKKILPYREKTRFVVFPANSVRMPFDPTASVVPARLAATMIVVVGIVLLIASANIAGMLLARAVGRAGEMAIRLVLGANGRRLIRQLLTESLLLSLVGGALGLLVASWLLSLFRVYTPQRYAVDVWMDIQVLTVTAGISIGVGLLIGLAPALRAIRIDLLSALPGSGTGVTKRVRSRLRYWIVIPQVGLSLVLLLAAGFHIRALMKIELTDLGYDPRGVVVLSPGLRPTPGETGNAPYPPGFAEKRAERSRAFYRQMLAGVQAIPGLGGTGFASMLPLNRPDPNVFNAVAHEEFLAGRTDGTPSARTLISPGYLRAMGIALRAGRDFDERDTRTTPRVAIVSENLARQLWPGRDPIGRSLATRSNHPATNERLEWLEVVGVVDDIDPILRERSQNPYVYLSLGQEWQPAAMNLVARVQGDQAASVQRLKQAVLGADPLADVYQVQTLGQMVATILYPRRLAGAILTASGLIGMLLASLGLYGVVSYSVAQRVQEIGIRATLGADARDIVRLIVSEGVRVVAAGTALGFGLSYSALRITSRFVTVPAIDPITLIATPAVLTAVVLLACYLPARRAARADPMVALRQL